MYKAFTNNHFAREVEDEPNKTIFDKTLDTTEQTFQDLKKINKESEENLVAFIEWREKQNIENQEALMTNAPSKDGGGGENLLDGPTRVGPGGLKFKTTGGGVAGGGRDKIMPEGNKWT